MIQQDITNHKCSEVLKIEFEPHSNASLKVKQICNIHALNNFSFKP